MAEQRKLAAILAADVVGFSRLTGTDEDRTLARLRALRSDLIDPTIAVHTGRVVKRTGDGALVEFRSVVDAVRCAIEVQTAMLERNAGLPPERRIEFRIGIHLGDVVEESDGDLMGDGVNIAARLEGVAKPGTICLSEDAYRQVRARLDLAVSDLGEKILKNIVEPMRVYSLEVGGTDPAKPATKVESDTPNMPSPRLAMPDKPSIAVLPFKNMSGDPEQAFFADGIVEDITAALSRLRWLFVISRNSAFTYKDRSVETKQIGRELGVRYLLEGSVRRASNRIRITAQLIAADSGAQIWAERYDRLLEDIFVVQDEITETILATLEPEISASERDRAQRRPPDHLGAWELYQRGMWHLLRRNNEELPASQACFRDAIALDPNFALPHAALAVSCFFYITYGLSNEPAATLDELVREASQAVALDRSDAFGHSALGLGFMERGDPTSSISEHEIAIALNPNSAFSRYAFGYALEQCGRFDEAVEQFDKALRLSPKDPAGWSYLTLKSSSLYQLGRYEEVVESARHALRYPVVDVVWAHVHLTAALGQLNRTEDARAALAGLRELRPGLTISKFLSWPHIANAPSRNVEHSIEGLRRAGLPE